VSCDSADDGTTYASLIVPVKGRIDLVEKFLLRNYRHFESAYGATKVEMIVSDDGSSDEEFSKMRRLFHGIPQIHLIKNTGSHGFGNNCNFAASKARGSILAFVNTDVDFTGVNLAVMTRVLFGADDVFSVVPTIYRDTEGFDEAVTGGQIRKCELKVTNSLSRRRTITYGDTIPILWPTGALFFCKSDRFWLLGGFSKEFSPAYSEDVDLGIRAIKAGMKNIYVSAGAAIHYHNSSMVLNGRNWVDKNLLRGHIILNIKHMSVGCVTVYGLRILWEAIRKFDYSYLSIFTSALLVTRAHRMSNTKITMSGVLDTLSEN